MRENFKKFLKALLVLIVSIFSIYLIFTIIAFTSWCNDNQISMFLNSDELLLNLDSSKIQELGNIIGNFEQLMEESLSETNSLAQYYNPLGYSVWVYMQTGISDVLTRYLILSVLSGISIAIAYVILTSKRLKNAVKFILGYFIPIIIVPQILYLRYFYRFFGIFDAYYNTPYIQYFYIAYTTIFALMYIINYKLGIKMAKKLNQAINIK